MGLFDFGKKTNKSSSIFGGGDNAPMEKYIREEERWHAWECPHDDPYDCNEGCY